MKKLAALALLLTAGIFAEDDKPVQPLNEYVKEQAQQATSATMDFFTSHPQWSKLSIGQNHPYFSGYAIATAASFFAKKPRIPARVLGLWALLGYGIGFGIDGYKNSLPKAAASVEKAPTESNDSN